MADATSSAVTVNREWKPVRGDSIHYKQVTLVLTGQGTTTNKIPASALGLSKIVGGLRFAADDDSIYYDACPDYAGDNLILLDTDDTEVDVTDTIKGVVIGYE